MDEQRAREIIERLIARLETYAQDDWNAAGWDGSGVYSDPDEAISEVVQEAREFLAEG